MLKKFSNEISSFMRYIKEADGDDQVSVTVAPRQNRGTDYSDDSNNVNVPPRANRGTDYSADTADDEPAADTDQGNQDAGDDTPAEPDTGDDGTDYSNDDNADNPDEGNEENNDDPPAQDEGGEDEDQGDAPAEPDTGDGGTDYSSDNGGDDAGGEDTGNEENSEDSGSNESDDEKLKKYHMYTRFVHLYNILNSMIEKCKNVVKPDAIQNAVIKTVINNLSDVYDNMFDFMTIKYKSSTYVQILFYYETVISVVQLNFELLRNNHINLKQ